MNYALERARLRLKIKEAEAVYLSNWLRRTSGHESSLRPNDVDEIFFKSQKADLEVELAKLDVAEEESKQA